MSVQLIQQYRAKVEQLIRYGGSHNESVLRGPFQALLEQYARSKNLLLGATKRQVDARIAPITRRSTPRPPRSPTITRSRSF